MSTAKRLMHDYRSSVDECDHNECDHVCVLKPQAGYFEALPKGTQSLVKELILDAANDRNGPEGYLPETDCIKELECHSRDGFIADPDNKGGYTYKNFTTLMEYWGGGYGLAHGKANVALGRLIDGGLNSVQEDFLQSYGDILKEKGLTPNEANYHALTEANDPELKALADKLSDLEYEALGDDNASVMHEFRFMYHGKSERGLHSASVSAAVNLEGPYHRSSISWAPEVFCEGAKEVEITWRNQAELKRKLAKALAQVSKAVF